MRQPRGFTLIEMMMVVTLAGVLSALAVANYQVFTARGKRTEAYALLSGVKTAQVAHFVQYGEYAATFDELGFEALGGRRISATEVMGQYYRLNLSRPQGPQSYYCSAVGNLDNDPWPDVIVVAQTGH